MGALRLKVCVLGVWQDTVVWPLIRDFVSELENQTGIGRQVCAAAEEVLGKGFMRHLHIDRGYLHGPRLTALHERGTQLTIGVKRRPAATGSRSSAVCLPSGSPGQRLGLWRKTRGRSEEAAGKQCQLETDTGLPSSAIVGRFCSAHPSGNDTFGAISASSRASAHSLGLLRLRNERSSGSRAAISTGAT